MSALILLLLMHCTRALAGKPYKNYVVLISFDAFRWDYPLLYDTPNLDRMAAEGVKSERLIPSFPTATFPNHYTLATGLYPDHHGIVNNTFPDIKRGLVYRIGDRSMVGDPAFYGGEPVWNTAEKKGIRSASFFWVGSEAPIEGRHPSYWKIFDESVPFGSRVDTVIKWLSYPAEKRPGFVTLYFEEPDATSHDFGPVSPETGEMVETLDSLLGVLRTGLSGLPYAGKINVIVVSDHGMSEISPERYIDIYSLVPSGMIDMVYGSNPVLLIDPAEGKKDSILFLLNNHEGLKAYNKSDLPPRLHYGTNKRIPDIVVLADSSWSIGTRPEAPLTKGTHGYDNLNTDMHGIFYACGPVFKRGSEINQLNNTDIYNMICRILKIKPAVNDGTPAHIRKVFR